MFMFIVHIHAYVRASNPTGEMENTKYNHQDLYGIIIKDGIKSAFPNVEVVLRMFLSLMVTNCTGERSFSQLKRIKTNFAPQCIRINSAH